MRFEILIGMICSGKSTYSRQRAREGALIVNDDSIVNALHADEYTQYNDELKYLYKNIEYQIMCFAASHKKDIIIDRPNLNYNTRQRYIQLAKSLDYEIILGICFPIESCEIHAKRRFSKDSRGRSLEDWNNVSRYHMEGYQKPEVNEGFTELIYV